MAILIALHLLASVIWVGGMFFAHMALRPAAVAALEPPQRLPLWEQTLGHFFRWVWVAILTLLATGYGIIFAFYHGMAGVALYVHIMNGLGLLMMGVFMHVYFAPYRRLRQAVAAQDWSRAAGDLAQIRLLVTINLVLGLTNVAIGGAGRYGLLG
jgi:uncharacterized membrane protein